MPEQPVGRVGPNAILQTIAALDSFVSAHVTDDILAHAGIRRYRDRPPRDMVGEGEVAALFRAIVERLPRDRAQAVLRRSGSGTADYILAHRIPRVAQRVIKLLPKQVALRVLLQAIGRNAWTFAGSGHVSTRLGLAPSLSIRGNAIAHPDCLWHVAVFERLFAALVSPAVTVEHPSCCSRGDRGCHFDFKC
ncbi:MAG: bacteriochlorophyll 4-vinyl reductase [Hyphomicrobiaceae bacterium]